MGVRETVIENGNPPERKTTWAVLVLGMAMALNGCGGGESKTGLVPTPVPVPKPVPVPVAKAIRPANSPRPNFPNALGGSYIDPQSGVADVFHIVPPSEHQVNPEDLFTLVSKQKTDSDEVSVRIVEEGATADSYRILKYGQIETPNHAPNRDFKLPKDFEAVTDAGYGSEGLPLLIRSKKDNAEMVLVAKGGGVLGTNNGPANAGPQLKTELTAFYMDRTEVTIGQYRTFLEAVKKDEDLRVRLFKLSDELAENLPVTGISWGDAVTYCRWAGKSLPTESQWEKAARGPAGFPHPWGQDAAIWFPKRTPRQINEVMQYPTDLSPYGIFDLAGNAREWCLDWYRPDAFASADPLGKPLANWEGPKAGEPDYARVVKGNGPGWNLWHREGVIMRREDPTIGFRCVFTPAEVPAKTSTTEAAKL